MEGGDCGGLVGVLRGQPSSGQHIGWEREMNIQTRIGC